MTTINVALSPARPVGQLHTNHRRGRLTSTFTYSQGYLEAANSYAIDPALPLQAGAQPSAGSLPRAILDAAPDRWGRHLIDRRVADQSRAEGTPPPRLDDAAYLLGASDLTRQGALRFGLSPSHEFLDKLPEVPKLIALPSLLQAANTIGVQGQPGPGEALKALLDAGSASLGGARPKACVASGSVLYLAKFPHRHDAWDVMAWEKTALDLALAAGVTVPDTTLERLDQGAVLLSRRFDRLPDLAAVDEPFGLRRGYISALTALQAADGEVRDYLEIAEAVTLLSVDPSADLAQLWRRIAFTVAIGNTDDHLRNHGFLRVKAGWRLAPAFDINPNPDPAAVRVTPLAGAVDRVGTVAALSAYADWFGLTATQAQAIRQDVTGAVQSWRTSARQHSITRAELERFANNFEAGLEI